MVPDDGPMIYSCSSAQFQISGKSRGGNFLLPREARNQALIYLVLLLSWLNGVYILACYLSLAILVLGRWETTLMPRAVRIYTKDIIGKDILTVGTKNRWRVQK